MMNGNKTMTTATLLDLVTVFFAGMLAGMEFVIHYGFRAPAETLDDRAQPGSARPWSCGCGC